MAKTLISAVEIKQTNTEAWTKNFVVTTKSPTTPTPILDKVRVSTEGCINESQVIARAPGIADHWVEQELLKKLCSYSKDEITGQDSRSFTLVEAAKVPGKQNPQSASWEAKDSSYISQDVEAAVEALGKSMELEQSSMNTLNMILFYPLKYSNRWPFFKAQKSLEQSYPQLKLVPKDNHLLTTATNGSFALLLCEEKLTDKIGTFEFLDSVKLFQDDEPSVTPYAVEFSHYSLSFSAPKQIVVLTGI